MGNFQQFRIWLKQLAKEACLGNQGPQDGGPPVIEVWEATGHSQIPRPCYLGGTLHCMHGKDECCWCELRQQVRN